MDFLSLIVSIGVPFHGSIKSERCFSTTLANAGWGGGMRAMGAVWWTAVSDQTRSGGRSWWTCCRSCGSSGPSPVSSASSSYSRTFPLARRERERGHFSQTSNLAGFAVTPPNLLGLFCRQKRSRAKRHTGEGHLPFCSNNQRLDLGVFRGASIIADR